MFFAPLRRRLRNVSQNADGKMLRARMITNAVARAVRKNLDGAWRTLFVGGRSVLGAIAVLGVFDRENRILGWLGWIVCNWNLVLRQVFAVVGLNIPDVIRPTFAFFGIASATIAADLLLFGRSSAVTQTAIEWLDQQYRERGLKMPAHLSPWRHVRAICLGYIGFWMILMVGYSVQWVPLAGPILTLVALLLCLVATPRLTLLLVAFTGTLVFINFVADNLGNYIPQVPGPGRP